MLRRCIISLLLVLGFCLQALGSDLSFRYRLGSVTAVSSYGNNQVSFEKLDAALSSGDLVQIVICGVSSPDGSFTANKIVSSERANHFLDYLRDTYPDLPDSLIQVSNIEEDWEGLKRILKKKDYPWKDEALQIIDGPTANRKGLLKELWVGEAWDELMKNVFPQLRRVDVSFVHRLPDDVDSVDIAFPEGIGWIPQRYGRNSKALENLRSLAAVSDTLYIRSSASPDGSAQANEKLSLKRARSVKDYLISLGFPSDRIVVQSAGEDWDGLAASLQDSQLQSGDEALGIIRDHGLSSLQKKQRLRSLDGGRLWASLMSGSQMSSLRRVSVSSK